MPKENFPKKPKNTEGGAVKKPRKSIGEKVRNFLNEPIDIGAVKIEKGTLTADEILRLVGMTAELSYYSGVSGNLRDINGEKLMKIYDLIAEREEQEVAKDFVRMIREMPSLAPINFIKAVQALAKNSWIYVPEHMKEALLTDAHVVSSMQDETEEIKRQFEIFLSHEGVIIEPVDLRELK